ncbi:MAG: hypothetical protein C0605_02290 [Hyphomicrobiales bacterium]|nr:MAG: hypothetical protein C0605_02290 [Hyphomicrobiales bacterium]
MGRQRKADLPELAGLGNHAEIARRVSAGCFPDNPASMRVQEKPGMRYTGKDKKQFSLGRGEDAAARVMGIDL